MRKIFRFFLGRLSQALFRHTVRLNDEIVSDLQKIVEECSRETAQLKLRVDELTLEIKKQETR
jgi:hypothetical protein